MTNEPTDRAPFRRGELKDVRFAVALGLKHASQEARSQQELDWWNRVADVDAKFIQNQITKAVDRERRGHGRLVFGVAISWVAVIVIVLVLEGFSFRGFDLPTSVLVALVGGATAAILGTLHTVTKSLFRE